MYLYMLNIYRKLIYYGLAINKVISITHFMHICLCFYLVYWQLLTDKQMIAIKMIINVCEG